MNTANNDNQIQPITCDIPDVIPVGDPRLLPLDHPMPTVVPAPGTDDYEVPKMKIGFGPEVDQAKPQ
ncbi:hypothetical protein TVAG_201630 [Trichomonas vaginalis G3]|uniref:Uncharacterized protein n=1 Tax=Trichomonas vaginalis (strain ATCC PRA-98 / G3) TaxID=412133 RepID=A2DWI4_TRIV3|nr:hypothetical protein TVAGG3_0202290 [Trichomonas vaginalis G3]EAY15169.1 hypothetical protein TVAG_201630 [Trichomonas vaginalis G3]KAI5550681.1 hypothetical protein TVAGG3_0202290 [Trichomonas vaginalis G3]|eukprot:XP_001327392.1 hypothetical protein [Trichomonas vaginalis G3]